MFLRKKPNKSGSTSVQVIVKTKNRKQRVVKTIGSSRDTDEIERLMAEGRKYISDQNGPLFPDIDEDENAVDAFVGSLTNSQIKVVGPELIFGRLYDYIGFNSIPSEMFRHRMTCHLFNPGSKLKTMVYPMRYLHDQNQPSRSVKHRNRRLIWNRGSITVQSACDYGGIANHRETFFSFNKGGHLTCAAGNFNN